MENIHFVLCYAVMFIERKQQKFPETLLKRSRNGKVGTLRMTSANDECNQRRINKP